MPLTGLTDQSLKEKTTQKQKRILRELRDVGERRQRQSKVYSGK